MNIKQKNSFKKSLLSIAVAGVFSTSMSTLASEKENIEEIEVISVTASRTPMNIEDSLASQVVITRADIERIQPKSVLDMLSTVAGIDISTTGGRGQSSSVYMRGANSGHTLVLLNGVRISSASLGSTNVQNIAPELVERIEIVKGPRAALWGSDAIGGVIQIFTRKLNGGEHFVSANVGSEDYRMLNAGVGIEHGNGFTSISAEHEESDGFDARDDAETDDDGYSFDSLAINGQQQISNALSVNWLAQLDQGDTEYDSSFGANESEVNNHVWQLGANYDWQAGNVTNTTQFSLSQNRTSNIGYGNGISKDDGTQFDTRRNQYSLLNSSELTEQWQLNVGADLYQEELKGDTVYDESTRDTSGVFAHIMFNGDKLSYELATRYDDVEGIESEVTYNTSVGYQVTDSTQLSVSVGTGFKAPTFNDLYYPLQWGYVGNPDLSSETSESYEFSVKSQFDDLAIAVNVYQTDIEDLIDWSGSDKDGNVTPINVNNVDIQGAEFGANFLGFGGEHQFNVSYIEAEDAATGKQLGRRAKEHVSYQFDTSVGNTDIYAEIQYKGKRYDYLWGGDVVKLDSYSLVNLGVSYPISSHFNIQAKVNNAFDEQYQNSNGYFTQGRVVYFGISYQN
ncbi:MAG: TonB-dependent receptor [Colwellia sp.]|nr:TonB-dependent receptor [Colwellia sp.]MCW8866336.1 TonB-dependent receptor [Colwellia sp.]MCW9083093.1 TonB-dependent receptor [Colwellia sp.]